MTFIAFIAGIVLLIIIVFLRETMKDLLALQARVARIEGFFNRIAERMDK